MTVDNSYLEDEVRDQFYIPSMTKRAWAVELGVLDEVDKLCARYGIEYFLDWGSLIGAVRHGGFIPWDDDLDIVMKRKDYERFLEVAGELPEEFYLINYETHETCWELITNVSAGRRMCFEPAYLEAHAGFPYMAGIDIFILDYKARDDEKDKYRHLMVTYLMKLSDDIADGSVSGAALQQALAEAQANYETAIRKLAPVRAGELTITLPTPENSQALAVQTATNGIFPAASYESRVRVALYHMIEKLAGIFTEEESDKLTQIRPKQFAQTYGFEKELYERSIRVPFEGRLYPVPVGYDKLLHEKFGEYMRFYKDGKAHDYPFYEGQYRALGTELEYPRTFKARDIRTNIRMDGRAYIRTDVGANTRTTTQNDRGTSHRVVIFLPYRSCYWERLAPEYAKEKACPDTEVYVIPVPYYEKSYDESFVREFYDTEGFPEEVALTDYESVDLAALHPDRIYLQNPYDEYNMAVSVHPRFYASRLVQETAELIYKPYFTVGDFGIEDGRDYKNMSAYVTMPGVVYADRVILESEEQARLYRQKLADWGYTAPEGKLVIETAYRGENADNSPVMPPAGINENSAPVRKRLLYYTSISLLYTNRDTALVKLRKNLEIFAASRDEIAVTWMVDYAIFRQPEVLGEAFAEALNAVIRDFEAVFGEEATVAFEDLNGAGLTEYVRGFDAFYGDGGVAAKEFIVQKKPVMLANPDICG